MSPTSRCDAGTPNVQDEFIEMSRQAGCRRDVRARNEVVGHNRPTSCVHRSRRSQQEVLLFLSSGDELRGELVGPIKPLWGYTTLTLIACMSPIDRVISRAGVCAPEALSCTAGLETSDGFGGLGASGGGCRGCVGCSYVDVVGERTFVVYGCWEVICDAPLVVDDEADVVCAGG